MDNQMQNKKNEFPGQKLFNTSGEVKTSQNEREVNAVENNHLKGHMALFKEIIRDVK